MNVFKVLLQKIEGVPAAIAKWFTSHGAAIHAAISDAQTAIGVAIAGAAAEGSPAVANTLAKVSGVLATASTLVTAEANAPTLTGQATAIANTVGTLVDSGDIGVKSSTTQASVDNAVAKVQTVIGAMVTAAGTAPGK